MEVWEGESGSQRYSHANNDVVKCYGKAGLRVLCTLRRPLSMASCSLKAYGLKWQWGAGDAKAIISQSCTLAGNPATIKEGREGRNGRRSLTVTLLHSTHILTAEYTAAWGFGLPNISLEVLKAEIMSLLMFICTAPSLYHTLPSTNSKFTLLQAALLSIMSGGFNILCKST